MTNYRPDLSLDSGWAWIVLAACFCMNVLNAGYIKCFGILFVAVEAVFNATASVTSLLMGVNAAFYSITAFIVLNVVLERITIRTITITGAVILSTGVFINSFATNIYILVFSQGGLAGVGAAMLYGPGLVQVSRYFDRRRGMATAICSCGVSTGGMLLPPLVQYLITEYGLRGAFLIIAGILLQILVFVSLYRPLPKRASLCEKRRCKHPKDDTDSDKSDTMTRRLSKKEETLATESQRNEIIRKEGLIGTNDLDASDAISGDNPSSSGCGDDTFNPIDSHNDSWNKNAAMQSASESDNFLEMERKQSDKRYSVLSKCFQNLNLSFFKKPLYLLIFGFTACGFLGVGLFLTFLPPLAKEKGLTSIQAAVLVSLFNGLELVSRLLASFLAEVPYIKRYHMIALSMFLLGTLNQLTVFFNDFTWMISYVAVFGILNGFYPALHPAVIIDFVGLKNFSKVFGYVQVFHGAMMTACYPLMGVLRDMTGSYSASFHFLGACKLMSAVFLMLLPAARNRS